MKYLCSAVLCVSLSANAFTLSTETFSITSDMDDALITYFNIDSSDKFNLLQIEFALPDDTLLNTTFDIVYQPNSAIQSSVLYTSFRSGWVPPQYFLFSNSTLSANLTLAVEGNPTQSFDWPHVSPDGLYGWSAPFQISTTQTTAATISLNDVYFWGAVGVSTGPAGCASFSCMTPFKGQGSLFMAIQIPHAVPEAGAVAMTVAGLAVVGALALRRRSSINPSKDLARAVL